MAVNDVDQKNRNLASRPGSAPQRARKDWRKEGQINGDSIRMHRVALNQGPNSSFLNDPRSKRLEVRENPAFDQIVRPVLGCDTRNGNEILGKAKLVNNSAEIGPGTYDIKHVAPSDFPDGHTDVIGTAPFLNREPRRFFLRGCATDGDAVDIDHVGLACTLESSKSFPNQLSEYSVRGEIYLLYS